MLKDTRERHEYKVLRNQFYIGLRWSRSENAYVKGSAGESPGGFRSRTDPLGVQTHPNSAYPPRPPLSLSVWVSKSINNLYHLVHSLWKSPYVPVSPYRRPASIFSSPISSGSATISRYPIYNGYTDELMDLTLIDPAWSEIDHVQVLLVSTRTYFLPYSPNRERGASNSQNFSYIPKVIFSVFCIF